MAIFFRQEKINEAFNLACRRADVVGAKRLLMMSGRLSEVSDVLFLEICSKFERTLNSEKNFVPIIRMMCETGKIHQKYINKGFRQAVELGHLEVVKYFTVHQNVDVYMALKKVHPKVTEYLIEFYQLHQNIEKLHMAAPQFLDVVELYRSKEILSQVIDKGRPGVIHKL